MLLAATSGRQIQVIIQKPFSFGGRDRGTVICHFEDAGSGNVVEEKVV